MDHFTSMLIWARKSESSKNIYMLEARLRDACQRINFKHPDDEDTIRTEGLVESQKPLYMALRMDCLSHKEALDWLRRNE